VAGTHTGQHRLSAQDTELNSWPGEIATMQNEASELASNLTTLLGELSLSLASGLRAMLDADLDEIERQTARQRMICERVTEVRCGRFEAAAREEVRRAVAECNRAARLQAALLTRLQRGLSLMALFRSCRGATYELRDLRLARGRGGC